MPDRTKKLRTPAPLALVKAPPAGAGGAGEPGAPAPTESTREYTIDELAAVARVPSRTIRFYQSTGALPRPRIRGRVAYYDGAHINRLKLIGKLQDRGLRIRAIRELLVRADRGELALNEWLGLEQQLSEPWASDRPRVVSDAEFQAMMRDCRPGIVSDLIPLGAVTRRPTTYTIPSPALLSMALRLDVAGVDVDSAAGAAEIMRKHLRRAAVELVSHYYHRVGEGFGRALTATDLSDAYKV